MLSRFLLNLTLAPRCGLLLLLLQVAALRAPDGVMLSLVEAAAAVGAGEVAE